MAVQTFDKLGGHPERRASGAPLRVTTEFAEGLYNYLANKYGY
jgi:hypothetical protein